MTGMASQESMEAAAQQGAALRAVAAQQRARLCAMYDADGGKSKARAGFKKWHRESQLHSTVGTTLESVLGQELYNRGHWRNTASVVLFEQQDSKQWGPKAALDFVHRTAVGEECGAQAVARIKDLYPRLRQVPQADEWMAQMMLPFRSAVICEVAARMVQQALDVPLDAADDGGAEWRHLLVSCPGGRDDLVAISDSYEEAVLQGRRAAPAAQQLRKWADKEHHVGQYYFAAACASGCAGPLPADRVADLLRGASEQGVVPAMVGFAAALLRRGRGGDAVAAVGLLSSSLAKGDALQYPLAAFLLARAHDGQYGGRRSPALALKWYQECGDLAESAASEGRFFCPGEGRFFPFWPPREGQAAGRHRHAPEVSEREALRECRDAQRRLEKELSAERERREWWRKMLWGPLRTARASPLFFVYAGLVAVIAVLAATLAVREQTGPACPAAPGAPRVDPAEELVTPGSVDPAEELITPNSGVKVALDA